MIALLTAGENKIFLIALAVMLMIALLEGVASLLGAGLSGLLDSLIPEVDADVVDIDLDATAPHPPALTRFLSWLRIGEVPVLMLLVVFLTAFGLIGLTMQSIVFGVAGVYLPQWIAAVPALFLSLPVVRVLGGLLAMILPKDETTAVYEASFVGRIATLTLGTAVRGSPAEAKLVDEHGQAHYVLVEPDAEGEAFERGTQVLITERRGAVFRAIRNTTAALVD